MAGPWQEFNWGVFWALLAALLIYSLIRALHWFLIAVFSNPDNFGQPRTTSAPGGRRESCSHGNE
jgi:NhaP-type Na+/H+ or K+/H+ antiporter